jgi:ABC-type transport system involved in multi-copper enzyme maturation permease subunit
MTGPMSAIALNTFREAVRDRVLYLLLFFALGMITASRVISLLTVGSEEKIIKDIGLASIGLFGVLTAVLIGVSLVFKEIDKRTAHVLLARPIRRWQFLVGKYLGLALVLAVNCTAMTTGLYLLLAAYGDPDPALLPAIGLIFVEQLVMTAVALLFSSFSTPILSVLLTLSVYTVGHLSWSLHLLRDRLPTGAGRGLCQILYYVLPNLERFNIKGPAVHHIAVPPLEIGLAVLYGAGWVVVLLFIACAVFGRRDFV